MKFIQLKNILIYFSIFSILIGYEIYKSNSKNCMSLIIPSTEQDFLKCYKQFFYYSDSFLYAKEIIIAISSVKKAEKIKTIIKSISFSNKIILGLRSSNHNAASNRNYGFKLSKCKFISFFDIDDIMSINRLPILYNTLKNELTTEFVLHKFTSTCIDLLHPSLYNFKFNISYKHIYESYKKKYNNEKPNRRWCCKYIDEIKNHLVHNGWPTMRRYIMEKIKYNISYMSGQDSDFNSRVILNGYNTSILNISLGFYKKDNSCVNFKMCKLYHQ